MGLEHKHPHCTGLWDQQGSGAWVYWRREQCDAIADHSIEVGEAALQEKRPGTHGSTQPHLRYSLPLCF